MCKLNLVPTHTGLRKQPSFFAPGPSGPSGHLSVRMHLATAVCVASIRLSMVDFPLMLWMKLPVVDKIYSLSNKFAMGV